MTTPSNRLPEAHQVAACVLIASAAIGLTAFAYIVYCMFDDSQPLLALVIAIGVCQGAGILGVGSGAFHLMDAPRKRRHSKSSPGGEP